MEVKYKQYIKNRPNFIKKILFLEDLEKSSLSKERNMDGEFVLTYLDKLRWKTYPKEKKIIYLGSRIYRIKI